MEVQELSAAEKLRLVRELVKSGSLDDELPSLASLISGRQQVVAVRRVRNLKPGDLVTIVNTKPQYLNGLRAFFVERHSSDRLEVELVGGPVGRYGAKIMLRSRQILT